LNILYDVGISISRVHKIEKLYYFNSYINSQKHQLFVSNFTMIYFKTIQYYWIL